MADAPLISAIVRVLNEAEELSSFLKVWGPLCDEFIVVDSGSSDGTPDVARRYPQVNLLRWEGGSISPDVYFTPEGPIYNMALSVARGEWVFLLAADERPCRRMQRDLRAMLSGIREDNVAFWGVHFVDMNVYAARWLSQIPGRLVRRDPEFRFPNQTRGLSFPLLGDEKVYKADMALFHRYWVNRRAKTERYYRLQGKPIGHIPDDILRERAESLPTAWPATACHSGCQECVLSRQRGEAI